MQDAKINPKIEFIIMSDGNKISNRVRGQQIVDSAWKGVKEGGQWAGKKVVAGGKGVGNAARTVASAAKTAVTAPPKAAWKATKTVGNAIHKTGVGATKFAAIGANTAGKAARDGANALGRGVRDTTYSAIGATAKGLDKAGQAAKYVDKKVGQNAAAQKLTSGVLKAGSVIENSLEAIGEAEFKAADKTAKGIKSAFNAIGNQYNKSVKAGDRALGLDKFNQKSKEELSAEEAPGKISKGLYKIGKAQVAALGTGVRAGKATRRALGAVKDLFKGGAIKSFGALEKAIEKTGLTKLLKKSEEEFPEGDSSVKPKKDSISERTDKLLGKLKAAGKKFPGVETLLNWFKRVDSAVDSETQTEVDEFTKNLLDWGDDDNSGDPKESKKNR